MFLFRTKAKSYITVLDIGTFKVCGFMAHLMADGTPEIIGVGFAEAKGISAGTIVDLDKATECIGAVLTQIERQAGHAVESVTVNISSAHLKSHHLSRETAIDDDHPITASDVKHLVDEIIASVPPEENVLHSCPLSYTINKDQIVAEPWGLYADSLKAYVHVITIQETELKNLVTVLDRCHVDMDYKVATPYATALAVLTDEEKDVGATLLDIGAGTTSFALFMNGWLMHLGLIPQGGNQMTRDIARGLSCSMTTAERLKTLSGAAFLSPRDELERLIVPMIGEETENNTHIPRSELIKIIIPRLEEILEQVGIRLNQRESFSMAAHRIVLAGGTAQLQGIKEKIEAVLNTNVRIGKANVIKNLPNQFDSYTFLTCIGLLRYVMAQTKTVATKHFRGQNQQKSRLGKVLQWLMK
ncbi:MAG: cell division protein FtsA [Alphaproteobacteria bacterium]|nr:cell division protein FtsA [Alphaproteobacteria bacterium]